MEVILKLARFYDQSPGILMEMAGVTPPAADEQLEAQLVHTFRRLNDSQRRLALMLIESIEAHGKSEAHHF